MLTRLMFIWCNIPTSMKKILTSLVIAAGLLLPYTAGATVFSSNQVITNPSYGVVMSTSTASSAKLFASSSPTLGTIYATSTTATSSLQNTSVNQFKIGTLSGILRAVNGFIQTTLVNLASDITGTLSVANGGTSSTTLTGLLKGNGTSQIQTAIGDSDYQKPITLTTTGTSGVSTFIADILNIPNYANTTYTAAYPITLTGTVFGTAFGTTTNNVYSGTNTFNNGITTNTLSIGSLSGTLNANAGNVYSIATTSVTNGSGISFTGTAGALIGGSNLTINNTGVLSNIAGAGIAVSGATGNVTITNTIGYPFLSNATTTLLTFNGGATLANSVTLSGITGSTQCLHVNTSGVVSGTGADCGTGSGGVTAVTASYPIISSGGTTPNISTAFSTTTINVFSALNTFNGGLTIGSLTGTLNANNGVAYATATSTPTFSTGLSYSGVAGQFIGGTSGSLTVNTTQNITNLSNLVSNGLVKTSGGTGALSIATAGTDYQAPITLTTTGSSGVATFISNTLNIPNYTGSFDPFTHPATGQSATTTLMLFFGQASTSQLTATSSVYLSTVTGGVNIGTSSSFGKALFVEGSQSGGVAVIQRDLASTPVNSKVGTYDVRLNETVAGSLANGSGPAQTFGVENGGGAENIYADIAALRENADTNGSLALDTYNGGVAAVGLYINHLQQVGFGTTTPIGVVDIASTTGSQLVLTNPNAGANLKHWNFTVFPNGSLNIGTTSDSGATSTLAALSITPNSTTLFGIATSGPWRTLSVSGTVAFPNLTTAAGTVVSVCLNTTTGELEANTTTSCIVSSEKYKTDIHDLNINALSLVDQFQPKSFVYLQDSKKTVHWGFIAEDVVKVNPLLGSYDKNGNINTYDEVGILAIDTEAIQELQKEIASPQNTLSKDWYWLFFFLFALYIIYNEWDKHRV